MTNDSNAEGTVKSLIRKVRERYRGQGVVGLAEAFLARLPFVRTVYCYHVCRLPLTGIRETEAPPEVSIELVRDAGLVDVLTTLQSKPELFRGRLREGHLCLMASVEGRPVAYLWAQPDGTAHRHQVHGFSVPIAAGQIYIYDGFVRPDWRRRGLIRSLEERMGAHAIRNLGKRELVGIIESSNLVSLKAHARLGFVRGRARFFVRIGRLDFTL